MRWYGLAPIAGAFLLGLVACSSYVTTVQPVEDEILVKLVADPLAAYDHPVRLTVQDLTAILQHIQVEYKAGWLQNVLTGPLKAVPLFDPEGYAVRDRSADAYQSFQFSKWGGCDSRRPGL